jgi:hypothetical protein
MRADIDQEFSTSGQRADESDLVWLRSESISPGAVDQ